MALRPDEHPTGVGVGRGRLGLVRASRPRRHCRRPRRARLGPCAAATTGSRRWPPGWHRARTPPRTTARRGSWPPPSRRRRSRRRRRAPPGCWPASRRNGRRRRVAASATADATRGRVVSSRCAARCSPIAASRSTPRPASPAARSRGLLGLRDDGVVGVARPVERHGPGLRRLPLGGWPGMARRYGGPGWGLATCDRGLPGRSGSWPVEPQMWEAPVSANRYECRAGCARTFGGRRVVWTGGPGSCSSAG